MSSEGDNGVYGLPNLGVTYCNSNDIAGEGWANGCAVAVMVTLSQLRFR